VAASAAAFEAHQPYFYNARARADEPIPSFRFERRHMKLSPTSRAGGLAFLTAAVTLFMQVLVHRMVSAKLMNNFAFLVISLSMLGFACSGVVLSRWLDRLLERFEDAVTTSAALFVLSALGSTALFYRLDAGHQFVSFGRDFVLDFGRWMPMALPLAVPFAFCGLILGMLLSDPRFPTRQVYFADLLGSAVGAFSVILAIERLGVEASALGACAVMLVTAVVLAPPRRRWARGLAAAAAVALAVAVVERGRIFDMRYPSASMLWHVQQLPKPYGIEHIAWDPVTRIEVSRIQPPNPGETFTPSLIGTNRAFLQRFERMLTQNNFAFTYAVHYDGRPESLLGIEETVYASAYHASSVARPRVLVIGVGGGFDVLTALRFDASEVIGLEVNAATVDVLRRRYRDYFRHWVEDPRVHIVAAEGRHYLSTTPGGYDVIQLSGVDSYSGTPGAAHVFSENYLYTAEAFDLYLSRLSPTGILNMMRVEFRVPRDMLRALVTAVEALRRAGAPRPEAHIMTLTEVTGHYTALLVKKTPFTEQERGRLAAWASQNTYLKLSSGPGMNDPTGNMYQRFLSLADPRLEAEFVRGYPFDVSATPDDRPFFFRHSFWWHVFSSEPIIRDYSPPVMEYTLLALLAAIGVAVAACVYLPLRLLAARGLRVPGAFRYGVFFAGIGLGYLAVEVALLQKFGLFLGHPNYALSVVLASLLLTTGLGSLFSREIMMRIRRLRFMSYVLAACILAEHLLVLPHLAAMIGLPFWARTAIVFGLVTPIGLCLGTFFPTALEQLKATAGGFVPWAWGINGIFSVLAPVLSVGVSMSWGINALLLAAVPVYLAAAIVFPDSAAPDSSPSPAR
jgi:spermidine synthase